MDDPIFEDLETKDLIAHKVLEFLRESLHPGQEAEVAINPELRKIVIHADGRLILSCDFDDLLGPAATN